MAFLYKPKALACFLIFICAFSQSKGQAIINTIAGNGHPGYSGDNALAVNAELSGPAGICADAAGNLYIPDFLNSVIRKVDHTTGIITTIAGNGTPGFAGDSGLATHAELFYPYCVFVDHSNNIYIADAGNNRIRKIDQSSGIISTIAGSGAAGFSGDNGPATNALLSYPTSVCADDTGNIYIADLANNRVRMINHNDNTITTIAGSTAAFFGDSGLAVNAKMNQPWGICLDASNDIYIADYGNYRVRKIDANTHIIMTVAGNGTSGNSGNDVDALSAQLKGPVAVYVDVNNNLYISDQTSSMVRRVNPNTRIITTISGDGNQGYSGDMHDPVNAELNGPSGICADAAGDIYIADFQNQRVRKITGLPSAVNKEALPAGNLNVWPNPSNGNFTVTATLSNSKEASIQVFNTLGQMLYLQTSTLQSGKLNTQLHLSLAPGIYTLHVKGDESAEFVQKLML